MTSRTSTQGRNFFRLFIVFLIVLLFFNCFLNGFSRIISTYSTRVCGQLCGQNTSRRKPVALHTGPEQKAFFVSDRLYCTSEFGKRSGGSSKAEGSKIATLNQRKGPTISGPIICCLDPQSQSPTAVDSEASFRA